MDIPVLNVRVDKYYYFEAPVIKRLEKTFNGKYLGDFCIRQEKGNWSLVPVSVFYIAEPEKPEYSNYLGIYTKFEPGVETPDLMLTDAASFKSDGFVGALVDGTIYISSHRHDYVQINENSYIDGGRDYLRGSLNLSLVNLDIVDGKWVLSAS